MSYLVNVKLPKLVLAGDYHEFDDLGDKLKFLSKELKVAEVGFNGTHYVGVVYAGRKPGKAELRDLAAEQRIVLEDQLSYD